MSLARAKRLEVILRLRWMAQERATPELGVAATRLAQARVGGAATLQRLAPEEVWLARLHQRAAGGGEIASATARMSIADEMVEAAGRAIATGSGAVSDGCARLAEATMARSVVERLRDRALEAAGLDGERREIAGLGEPAGARHAWQVRAGEPG